MRIARNFQNRLGARCVRIFTYPTLEETVLDPYWNIPTSPPGTPQYTKTPSSSDLVTTDKGVQYMESIPYLVLFGVNNDSSARTLYWEYKNGSNTQSSGSTGVNAGSFWTLTFIGGDAMTVNQDLTVKLWGGSTNLMYSGSVFGALANKIKIIGPENSRGQTFYFDCRINTEWTPSISVGIPVAAAYKYLNLTLEYGDGLNWTGHAIGTGTYDFATLKETSDYGIGMAYMWPDYQARTDDTHVPYYNLPNRIYSFRGTPVRVVREGKYVEEG